MLNDNVKLDVLLSVAVNPQINSRQIAADTNSSKRSKLPIVKKDKFHPYKIHNVQDINMNDPDRRMQFCEVMQDLCHQNPINIQVLFSDKATLCLNGTVYRQTCRYGSKDNSHWITTKSNAGIIEDRILGPFFDVYCHFIQNEFRPALTDIL